MQSIKIYVGYYVERINMKTIKINAYDYQDLNEDSKENVKDAKIKQKITKK